MKYYYKPEHRLVNDPTSALNEGDVIRLAPERHSKHVMFTVSEILAPFSTPVSERPPLLTQEQRDAIIDEKRRGKVERRALRGVPSALEEGRRRGWSVPAMYDEANREGHNVERATTVSDGREALPGGRHKFGKIGDEAKFGANRALSRMEKGKQNEKEKDEAAEKSTEGVTRKTLEER